MQQVLKQHFVSQEIVDGLSIQLCVSNSFKQLQVANITAANGIVINEHFYDKLRAKGLKKISCYRIRWEQYVKKPNLCFNSECMSISPSVNEAATSLLALVGNDDTIKETTMTPEVQEVTANSEPIVPTNSQENVTLNQNTVSDTGTLIGTTYYYMYIIDNVFDVVLKLGIMSFEISGDDIHLNGNETANDMTQIELKLKGIARQYTIKRYKTCYSASIDPVIFPLKTEGRFKESWIQNMVMIFYFQYLLFFISSFV